MTKYTILLASFLVFVSFSVLFNFYCKDPNHDDPTTTTQCDPRFATCDTSSSSTSSFPSNLGEGDACHLAKIVLDTTSLTPLSNFRQDVESMGNGDCLSTTKDIYWVKYYPYTDTVKIYLTSEVENINNQPRFAVMESEAEDEAVGNACDSIQYKDCLEFGSEIGFSIIEGMPFYVAIQERETPFTLVVEEITAAAGDTCSKPDPDKLFENDFGNVNTIKPRSEIKSGFVSCFDDESIIGWHWYEYQLAPGNEVVSVKSDVDVPISFFTDCVTEVSCHTSISTLPVMVKAATPGGKITFAVASYGKDSSQNVVLTFNEPTCTTIMNESFETWPAENFIPTSYFPEDVAQDSTEWKQVPESEYPANVKPTDGEQMAYCMVYGATSESAATLESKNWITMPLKGDYDSVILYIDFHHDNNTQYTYSLDELLFEMRLIDFDGENAEESVFEKFGFATDILRFISKREDVGFGWHTYSVNMDMALEKLMKFRIIGYVDYGKTMRTGMYIDNIRLEGCK